MQVRGSVDRAFLAKADPDQSKGGTQAQDLGDGESEMHDQQEHCEDRRVQAYVSRLPGAVGLVDAETQEGDPGNESKDGYQTRQLHLNA